MDLTSLRERDNAGAFSVSELNNYIKNVFENNRTLSAVTVRGEISNFTNHSSGHLYFSLKDSEGQIRAVMFRSKALSLKFMPESGMKVIVHGSVSVYTRDGSYQIYVSSMQPDGIGALYLAYEQLRQRLFDEGLFDENHKLPLPKYPTSVGVITSPTGAAVRDIINVIGRRFPLAKIYLYPSLVQGDGAEDNLIRAVDYFDKSKLADVVIIGRGGGSIEDLWAFNSEGLARRIFEAQVPIISAVGHETNFTICDFVSDFRAPTPSAAAEVAVPDARELFIRLDSYVERMSHALKRKVINYEDRIIRIKDCISPSRMNEFIDYRKNEVLIKYKDSLSAIRNKLLELEGRLAINAEKANALSPLSAISRGYLVAENKGALVKSKSDVAVGDNLTLKLKDGYIDATVTEIH